jgi:hypothetical protein
VEEYELDLPLDHKHPPGLLFFRVDMQRDGSASWVTPATHEDRECVPSGWTLDPRYNAYPRFWVMHLWARDAAHAVKIAGEWRTRLLAENLWDIDVPIGSPDTVYDAAKERIAACVGAKAPCAVRK